uniref:Chitinase domain-containing protein 1 n=1 Tax=Hordeum vulgare subsp. vulgare TaxID=112509 RepID=F2DX50_HORVV|nr:predicted protein [Hordeum vulgare subsp. vulgare]
MKKFSILSLILVISLASYTHQKSKQKEQSVSSVELVTEKPTYSSILKEHSRYSTSHALIKSSKFPTLGYVTPWNNHGYDVAKIFSRKFTYICPVWYQIVFTPQEKIQINGGHDLDAGWIRDVRNGSSAPRIVPRFLLENWAPKSILELAESDKLQESFISSIVKQCKDNGFDGIVLDTANLGMRLGNEHLDERLLTFYQNLGTALHKNKWTFILVEPPSRGRRASFESRDFMSLAPFVDHFSLMTYDFSGNTEGPNAPLTWMVENALSLIPPSMRSDEELTQKLLLGVPFYGYDFKNGMSNAITANTYLGLLKEHKPKFKWDGVASEHYFTYKEKGTSSEHTVYYPTLKFVHERLKSIEELGVGLAIWEIGQGLDYFYDLL